VKSARGIITIVQEQRFQLAGDDGSNRLFLLTHKAPLESLQARDQYEEVIARLE
jgi:hypothetical protein